MDMFEKFTHFTCPKSSLAGIKFFERPYDSKDEQSSKKFEHFIMSCALIWSPSTLFIYMAKKFAS